MQRYKEKYATLEVIIAIFSAVFSNSLTYHHLETVKF